MQTLINIKTRIIYSTLWNTIDHTNIINFLSNGTMKKIVIQF